MVSCSQPTIQPPSSLYSPLLSTGGDVRVVGYNHPRRVSVVRLPLSGLRPPTR